ncbi:hypothetical protein [Sorangium sp. So ce385]|uniref:hypothetical protein n=1 Tax=Sorangium sp. So ce385 TaxID=3133308 RepID=UPI003F5BA1D5
MHPSRYTAVVRVFSIALLGSLCAVGSPGCKAEEGAEIAGGETSVQRVHHGSVLIEERFAAPEHDLLWVRAARPLQIEFAMKQGQATFAGGEAHQAVSVSSDGFVRLPAIQAGPAHDESFIEVSVDGAVLFDDLRVATLPEGAVAQLGELAASSSDAFVALSDRFAIVDEVVFADDAGWSGKRVSSEDDEGDGAGIEARGLCVRAAWGPGRVEWSISNPSSWGYSVKPETTTSLVWAASPGQDIDGIYNSSWGCGTAYKVPDSCTATVTSNGISCCCNAAMAALGHVCAWVNPGAIGWANCPL